MRRQTFEDRRRLYLQALIAIRRHYDLPLTVGGVARGLGSSPRQLQRAFAQFGVQGFQGELRERRMVVAADLLLARELTVAEVAGRVGYRHIQSFVVAFRRRHGLSPGRFAERAGGLHEGASAAGGVSRRETQTVE